METYLKTFMRNLLEHKNDLNKYIDSLYSDKSNEDDLNGMFGLLKKEGLIKCVYADNRAYDVQLTTAGRHLKASDLKLSDKEELLLLIDAIDDIERYFHRLPGEFSVFEVIHDVPEFQEWLQQVLLYLQEIYDRTYDKFIWDSINTCSGPMNGTNDRKVFVEIAGKLRSIGKNINKYYSEIKVEDGSRIMKTPKTPMIFISHSSKDKAHVELIVKLLKDMGFNQNNVFCSSIPGYGIKLSKDIYDTLLGLFNEHNLYVIFVHSSNYYGSPVSLNEMGAAWALKTSFCSFLLPGFEYSDMKGVVDSSKISIKVDRDRGEVQNLLNELYEDLSTFFSIQRDTSIVWENARNEFIDRINATEVVADNKLSLEAFEILKSADKDDSGEVLITRSMEGVTIQAGNTSLNKPGIRREEAKMEAAVRELISNGLLTQTGTDVFQITNSGYRYLDVMK